MNDFPSFARFFQTLWDKDPFPWQTMLAERVVAGTFPDVVDLPTASGKTACIDVAVYVLAAQAAVPLAERRGPRRIWFVVDRRIVVDEAFDRAEVLADKLENATDPVLCAIKARLLALRGLPSTKRPLAVGRLRGGVLRDDRWARIPSQAAIITSTVDQLGSRLLFRGYGHSALASPIYAALAGNDSLILLDEAHCAVPFLQTLHAIKLFRSEKWSEEPNTTPFHVTVLSATPPGEDEEKLVTFPKSEEERAQALDHPSLQSRLAASKLAELRPVRSEKELTEEIAAEAERFVRNGIMRVGVIVNRIARAMEIADLLLDKASSAFDVKLLTGRIRPVERDLLVGKDSPLHRCLRALEPEKLARPLILVSTQCLEVGADFSFHALVTECASLDALRQRFGRLARLGEPESSQASIFVAESAFKDSDPIYGPALKATWEFLWSKAAAVVKENRKEVRTVDFGFEAFRSQLPPKDELRLLLAPTGDAPVLLPAHVDLLCQTSPLPHPNPDISLFLHGKGRKSSEVRVAFRSDFDLERSQDWPEIASLCRPVSGEMFSVPLYRLREWLRNKRSHDESGDVEGETVEDETELTDVSGASCAWTKFLIWRGIGGATVSEDPNNIYADSTILLPAPRDCADIEAMRQLGQALCETGFGSKNSDLWELAIEKTGKPLSLRLHRESLSPWLGDGGYPPLNELMELIEKNLPDLPLVEELREAVAAVSAWQPKDRAVNALPDWLRKLFERMKDFRFEQHPGGGIILWAKPADIQDPANHLGEEILADNEDAGSEAEGDVPLDIHCTQVASIAQSLTRVCLGEGHTSLFNSVGQWHDAGKHDPRFQEMLRGGMPDGGSAPLAKSSRRPRANARAEEIADAAGLPPHFRHEMLSAQLAAKFCDQGLSAAERELLLHLIASHHGHARPFAPVCEDVAPPAVSARHAGMNIEFSSEERTRLPAHRLDSGLADRFWLLTRRFGWWGLAYREAILRLADWHASEYPNHINPSQK